MKILLCHNFYRSKGGEDRCVELLSDLLTAKGHAVHPFFRHSRAAESYGWPRRFAMPFEMVYSLKSRSVIRSMVEADPPGLAYIHNLYPFISPSILSAIKAYKIPTILTMHAYKPLCTNGLFFTRGRLCEKCGDGNFIHAVVNNCRNDYVESAVYATAFTLHRWLKLIEPHVDIFITPSEFLKGKLIRYGYPENKLAVIPNFVSLKESPTSKRPANDYAVYFGRLSREKGVMTLLAAAKLSPAIEFVLAGDGPMRPEISKILEANPIKNIRLAGYQSGDDLWSLVSGAKFSIVPSESYETFPYSAIESLALGKPVVASRIGGLPEIIDDGVNGFLFNPGDPVDLAQKIKELWSDPERIREFGLNGERKAKSHFSAERFYERLSGLFQRLGIKED